MRQLGIISLIVCLAAASGCNVCCWGKRASELGAPTDVRKSVFWCLGEDAVFEQPCGPSREDYGLKQTCWREWPADGPRCVDGSCGPTMPAGVPVDLHPPQIWQHAVPNSAGPQANPFGDDPPASPTPIGKGAQLQRPAGNLAPNRSQTTTTGRSLGTTAIHLGKEPLGSQSNAAVPPLSFSQRSLAAPRTMPQSIIPAATQAVPPNQSAPLKITVSEPMDRPAAYLAPVAAPQAADRPAVTTVTQSTGQAETLAGLERMIDLPAKAQAGGPGPMVVQNDFAPASKPFRLATRTSLTDATGNAEVESKTLSALGEMMSDGAAAAAPH